MIHLFAHAITHLITGLPFVERWGGAAIPVTAPSSWTGPDGETASIMQSYPVSCSMEGICDVEGYYTKLLPNDAYTSISYLEALGPAATNRENQYSLEVRQSAKLVFWLNMQRIGAVHCGGAEAFALAAVKGLRDNRMIEIPEDVYQYQAAVKYNVKGITFEPAQVFGQYAYAVEQRLFLHPYAAFAINIDFMASIPMNCLCLPEFEPITCIEQW